MEVGGQNRPALDAQAALRFLADASAVLARSLDYEATLEQVVVLAVPDVADWAAIDVVCEEGGRRQITSGLPEPELEEFLMELRRRYRALEDQSQGTAKALAGEPVVWSDSTGGRLVDLTPEEEELYRRLSPQSYMIVPLIARGRTLGALTLLSRDPQRLYTAEDLEFAEQLARRFAVAIDNARLYDQAEDARALLDTLFATAPVGLAFLDRDLRFVRVNDAMAEFNGRPVEDHLGWPLAEVLPALAESLEPVFRGILSTGQPVVDQEVAVPGAGETRHFLANYYPVRGTGQEVLGIGVVVAEITERKRAEAEIAAALERQRFLGDAGMIFDASLDFEVTLANVANLVVGRLADWCMVEVLEPDGSLRNVATVNTDPARLAWAEDFRRRYPIDPDAESGVANVIRTGVAELHPEVTDEMLAAAARDEHHLDSIRSLGMRSVMVVPMTARGRTLGAITFISATPGRRYTEADLALALDLAGRAGMAADNARLYTELSRIADSLQSELLPTEVPPIPGIDVAVRYRAAGELNRVGGDFYDVFRRGEGEWVMVIGDVSGKGAPAAAVTALARYTLRTAASASADPVVALGALNDALLERRRDTEFCSVAVVVLSLTADGVAATASLGGHPPAILRRADGAVEHLGRPGMLLGFTRDPTLHSDRVVLGPGDSLLLYTDGVTDAGEGRDRFGDDRLARVVAERGDADAAALAEAVEHAAVGHAGDHPGDDMALVAAAIPSGFVRASQVDLGGGAPAVARARAAVAATLAGAVPDERLYDLQLLVSEVVTNSVRHGGAQTTEEIDFRISVGTDRIRFEVRDPGPGFEREEAETALPQLDRGGGYGLYFLERFSTAWGVTRDHGACVWFEVAVETPAATPMAVGSEAAG